MVPKRKRLASEASEVFVKRMHESKSHHQEYANHTETDLHAMIVRRGLESQVEDVHSRKQMLTTIIQYDRQTFPRFLDLPSELRNMVYEYASIANRDKVGPRAPPAIVRSSRLLRSEALPVFFDCNVFEIRLWPSPFLRHYELMQNARRNLRLWTVDRVALLDEMRVTSYIHFSDASILSIVMRLHRGPEPGCLMEHHKRQGATRSITEAEHAWDRTALDRMATYVNVFLKGESKLVFDEAFFERLCTAMDRWRNLFGA